MNYSFCIIGKNCASTLDRCLKPLKETGMEIVYTDTGSDDESVAIAEKYTDRIFHFKWCDDFSAARNFAMENCSNDMIFFVDSDEYLLLPSSLKETLNGISLPENAAITRGILDGSIQGHKRNAVLLNAGAAIYIGGKAESMADGIKKAVELIDSGAALAAMDRFIAESKN